MRVLITGDRNWDTLIERETIISRLNDLDIDTIIIHGDAKGVDRIAGEYWEFCFNKDLVEKYVMENIDAIVNSDILIFLNKENCRNTYTELGIAIQSFRTKGKPEIYMIGPQDLMYLFHPSINSVKNIDEIFLKRKI